ncbi:protein phosphatase 2C domain-containing protein [Streptomyces sp. NPDC051567]|uniref:protein phosphatase 2C domain-containing protein n=1 Tax=Streptomyces sp. NPDC051567 TaxID=3365660 RepID=UPI0037A582A5
MSQRGADDWWQKLYEDPETGAGADPGDTLDHRFRSAVVLVKGEAGTGEPVRGEPGRGEPVPPESRPPEPEPRLPRPRRVPAPVTVPHDPPVLPGAPPVRRDPRSAGETGYALGRVTVPPAERPDGPGAADGPATVAAGPPPAPPGPAPSVSPAADATPGTEPGGRPEVRHLGDRAPTYAAEPGILPPADPDALDALTPDTVLDGARYGGAVLRTVSFRGDSARFRGEARRDFLLTARFGTGAEALVLVALGGGDRAAPWAAEAAAELCRSVAAAVGRSREHLVDDLRTGRRDALRSGLQRLTDRGYGLLRARAAQRGLTEEAYTAGLRGLLLPADPKCRTRVGFGAGSGGLFRLRAGRWEDLEPDGPAAPEPHGGFRFRACVARPGDTLLLCSGGLAAPMREEGLLAAELAARWALPEPPGLAAFLADVQLRLKGYADDRTAAALWEA